MQDYTIIATATDPDMEHRLTEDEAVLLDQVIDIDGVDAVVLSSSEIRNGSGRVCGWRMVIADDAWEVVTESIAAGADDE